MSRLTATDALRISRKHVKSMNAIEYKRFVKSIMDEYGLEKNDAFSLVQGNNVLEIVAKYEKMPNKTNEDWFCSLNTLEKAKWFCDHIPCSDCRFNKDCFNEDMRHGLWQKWLLEEHREM